MTKATEWPCRGCGAMLSGRGGKRYCGPDCRPRCQVEGCAKPVHSKGMCSAHTTRATRYGDPLAPKLRNPNEGDCGVEDCSQPMRKVGLCANHYAMQRTDGEIREWRFKWGDGGYISTHSWIHRRKGPARDHDCVDCGNPAAEWSYNHTDPDALTCPGRGSLYSRNVDCYDPRCIPCHRSYDRAHRQLE